MPRDNPVPSETWRELDTGDYYTIRGGSTRDHLVIGHAGEPETELVRRAWFLEHFSLVTRPDPVAQVPVPRMPLVNETWVERTTGEFYVVVSIDTGTMPAMLEIRTFDRPRDQSFMIQLSSFLQQFAWLEYNTGVMQPLPGATYAVTEPEYVGRIPPQVDFRGLTESEDRQVVLDLAARGMVSTETIRTTFGIEPYHGVRGLFEATMGYSDAGHGTQDPTPTESVPVFRADVEGLNPMVHPTVNHSLLLALARSSEGFTYMEFMRALSPDYQAAYRASLQMIVENVAAGKAPLTPPENPSFWDRLEKDDA